ncbi:MAG: hypothetical protein ACXVB6_00535 [Mucilaginibacter sp.]
MKPVKYILLLIVIASLSSCGIFKKGCGCPHFGQNKPVKETVSVASYV